MTDDEAIAALDAMSGDGDNPVAADKIVLELVNPQVAAAYRRLQLRAERSAQIGVLKHQYDQVCGSYRAIDEFRAKLLALWPILGGAAGGAVILLSDDASGAQLLALGLFGAVVSVGLGIYEWDQSQQCENLVNVATCLEKQMGLQSYNSQFQGHPKKEVFGKKVGKGLASLIVYLTVIVGWMGIAIVGITRLIN